MSNKILIKRSAIQGKIPSITDLAYGEIALNTFDGKAYIKINDGVESIAEIGKSAADTAVDLNVVEDYYTGNGSQTAFTLTKSPVSGAHLIVTINGVLQESTSYTVSGYILTISPAPELYDTIEIRSFNTVNANLQLRDHKKFIYNITSTVSSISGADSIGTILAYDASGVDVYKNGLRLVQSVDYTANNGTSISFTSNLVNTDRIEVLSYGRTFMSVTDAEITTTNTALTTTAATQVVDTFTIASVSTVKYLCQIKHGTDIHASEIILTHNDTNVYMTEYGTIYSNGSLGTFTADIFSGVVRLLFSPISINTNITVKRISI